MQSVGEIILSCVNHENNFFENLSNLRKVTHQFLACMNHQLIANEGQDQPTLHILYKFFLKGVIASNQFFENFVDRREFLDKIILKPLAEIGLGLRSPPTDTQ